MRSILLFFLSNLVHDVENTSTNLGNSTQDNRWWGSRESIDFIVSGSIGKEFNTGFERHFKEGTDAFIHPNSIHSLHFTAESKVIGDQVQMSVINNDTINTEDSNNFLNDSISSSFNLNFNKNKFNKKSK